MATQLRMYTIAVGKMDEWVAGWSKGVYPLRLKQGFRIPGAWVIPEANAFVWIVEYGGPLSWDEAEAAYYGSPERKAMSPDPARLVVKQDKWFVRDALPR